MNIIETQPPHNDEAEQAVLGAILIDADALYDVAELLTPESFYRPAHSYLYEAIERVHGRGEPLDVLPLEHELRSMGKLEDFGGMDYLLTLMNAVITSVNATAYANIVRDAATRRRLIYAAGKIAKEAFKPETAVGDALALAEAEILSIGGDASAGTVKTPRRFMSDYIDSFMADLNATGAPRVISTGLADLDSIIGGLERQHQYIIAGATSMGKSSFALNVILDAVMRQGKRVMMFSLEMSEEQLVNRLVSAMTRIPLEKLKAQNRRNLTSAEQAAVMKASGELSDSGLYLDCTPGIKPADVRSRAARVYAEHGLDMIVVDHMHIMKPNVATKSMVEDLGSIALDLAETYKTLNVTGLTLAQLNREVGKRQTKIPLLSDLRESGKIEENAYCVIFLHRPAYYDPETEDAHVAKAIVAKQRDGKTGSADLYWNPELSSFGNLAAKEIDLNPPRQRNGVYSR